MACNYNIKVVEGNTFALVLPLKKRTYVSSTPIDEDIVYADLQEVAVKIGGVVYAHTIEEYGVQVIVPPTLAKGTYDIVLTATYHGSEIRAAYYDGLTIVAYNQQSSAQQYIAGSPIVAEAAFVIGGTLTDAELEALKEEYREKNAQLAQAIADAEEAKREWEQKAADLDGVAQESTSQEILTAVENIDIDTSDLAKEATLEQVKTIAQTSADAATIVNLLGVEVNSSKQNIIDLLARYGVSADMTMPLEQLAAKVDSLVSFVPFGTAVSSLTFRNNSDTTSINLSGIRVDYSTTWVQKCYNFAYIRSFTVGGNLYLPNVTNFNQVFQSCSAIETIDLRGISFGNNPATCSGLFNNCQNLTRIYLGDGFRNNHFTNFSSFIYNNFSLVEIDIENLTTDYATDIASMFYGCHLLVSLDLKHFNTEDVLNMSGMFIYCFQLVSLDLKDWSAAALTNSNQMFYNSLNIETLVGDTTYEDVVANDIKIFDQYNVTTNTNINNCPNVNRASLRAWINGLKDLTGQSSKTLTIGTTLKNKLSAEDIAVATSKNWVIN